MLIKRRPPKCTGFVENKYRHDQVMITNLYIVSHHLYDRHFIEAFYEHFVHALKKPGVLPHPLWIALSLLNQLLFGFGKCGRWEGIRSCTRWSRISQGWSIGDEQGSQRSVKMVWHDQLARSSLPYCKYGSIDLRGEKIVSNSPIDSPDWQIKDFIHIALA